MFLALFSLMAGQLSTNLLCMHIRMFVVGNLCDQEEASNVRRSFTLKDINLLKIVLCSGLYPQLAIADDCNSNRRDSEQVYHTKMKSFVLLHPTSVFATNPEYLHPEGKDKNKELLAYVDLLETNKPYLVNSMRVPALQTISLFSQSLDTNADCTRIIADSWLELKLPNREVGESVVGVVQTLRNTWSELLETKLQTSQSQSNDDRYYGNPYETKTAALEEVLATKLSEFLDSSFPYTLNQLSSTAKEHLYKGPPSGDQQDQPSKVVGVAGATPKEAMPPEQSEPLRNAGPSMRPHPLKGGWIITDYLTYNCLDESTQGSLTSQTTTEYIRRVWTCPQCQEKLAVTMAEQLQHQATCKKDLEKDAVPESSPSTSVDPSHLKHYHCPDCDKDFELSAIDILKHKRRHARERH